MRVTEFPLLSIPEVHAYTKQAPVYDKDNPPETLSEAIRMAAADVEAMDRAGRPYAWADCCACTAGAVVRRLKGAELEWGALEWAEFGYRWLEVLEALSELTCPEPTPVRLSSQTFDKVREAFGPSPDISFTIPHYQDGPDEWKANLLHLADRLERRGY